MKNAKDNLVLLILLTIFSILTLYSGINYPAEHPCPTIILDHPEKFEGKEVFLRGEIIGFSVEEEGSTLDLEYNGRTYTAIIPDKTLKNPEKGDIVDLSCTSHLEDGYVIVNDFLHRKGWQHKWLFYRSIIGLLLFGIILVIDYRRLKKVMKFA